MKKIRSMALISLILLCLVAACKKDKVKPTAPLQEVWTKYATDTVQAYTLDEEGNLYTYEFCYMGEMGEESKQYLRKYDIDGNRLFSKELERQLGSYVNSIAVNDGIVYFAPCMLGDEGMCAVLHSYNLETGVTEKIKEFPYFEQVNRILVGKDRIYLLGVKEIKNGRRSDVYSYGSEKIMYYVPSEDEIYLLGISEPIDMCLENENNLLLYTHAEEGFLFQRYDAKKDAINTIAKTNEYKLCSMAICENGKSIIYQTNSRGLVFSALSRLDVESELYPEGYFWDNNLCCVNGRVACIDFDGRVIQFLLDDVKKENECIRYISAGRNMTEPYGCGFEMQRIVLKEDLFALKVMALDRDFDICIVDSADSNSYNMKENGVFYPLNDVPGVEAYLDACFPYVREAATDEEGVIWMLPIEVSIPGFVMNMDMMGDYGFVKDMTFGEYFAVQAGLTKEEQCLTETPYVAFMRNFFLQYFMEYDTLDTQLFRETMRQFAMYREALAPKDLYEEKEGIYRYVLKSPEFHAYHVDNMCENKEAYGGPKLVKDSKNTGTCVFLAVNPYSDNLEATLDYLASWMAYTMNEKEKPLFFKNRSTGDSYEESLYELYRMGEIGFALDEEIYKDWQSVCEDITKLESFIMETDRKLNVYLME